MRSGENARQQQRRLGLGWGLRAGAFRSEALTYRVGALRVGCWCACGDRELMGGEAFLRGLPFTRPPWDLVCNQGYLLFL